MNILKKLRQLDLYGARPHLLHAGETNSGTLVGSVASISISALIFAYFVIRTLDVFNFSDPSLNSYSIREDRSQMGQAISYGEFG